MFVVCVCCSICGWCVLFARCLSLGVCRSLFGVCFRVFFCVFFLLRVVVYRLWRVGCAIFFVCWLMCVMCGSSLLVLCCFGVCYVLFDVCFMCVVVYRVLFVLCCVF